MNSKVDDHRTAQKHSQGKVLSGGNLVGSSKASQIKAALTAAKDLVAVQDACREHVALRRAGPAQRSRILGSNQRAAERLLTSVFEKSGSDLHKFEEIQAQNRAESRRILDVQRTEAVKHAAQAKGTFHSAVESRRKMIDHLVASTGATGFTQTSQVVLDAPFLIWVLLPAPDLFFDSYHIEPWNSWAKFKVDSTGSLGGDMVNFYFLWENSSDEYVLINVDSWLMLNGFCQVDIPGHWYETEEASIEVRANLTLLEWWNQPPTMPSAQADQYQEALYLDLEKGVLGSFISPWGERLFRTCDLRYNLELVPPQGTVVIAVGAGITWENWGGGVEADFDTGDFEVMCPFVQIQIMPWNVSFPFTKTRRA